MATKKATPKAKTSTTKTRTARTAKPTAKKPVKVATKTATTKAPKTTKAKTSASPELPGGMSAVTTKAPRIRVYSASVGFRSKVWGLLYAQRSNGNKVELCVNDGMTQPEAVKAASLLDSQESTEWVKVIVCPTKKQMRG